MSAQKRGFTLIELLVVIAIIAVLATIGATIFTGVQSKARDAKRRGDLDAIAKAMEINKISTGYQVLKSAWFSGAEIPYDPMAISVTDRTIPIFHEFAT